MFYVFEEINWRWCRHNTVPLSHIRSIPWVTASVRRQKGGGGERSRLGLSKSATDLWHYDY